MGVCDYNKEKKFYQNFKTVKIFAAILLISFLIAGPWILSVFNFVKLSTRSAGIESSGQDVINVFLRPGDIVNLFMPDVSIPDYFPNSFFLFGQIPLYFGALPLMLVFFSFFILRKQREKIILFFAGLFIFTVLTQFRFLHLYDLLHKLPVLNMFRGVEKWLYLGGLSVSILTAYGLDNLYKFKDSLFLKRFLGYLKYFIILAAIFFIFFNAFFAIYNSMILNKVYDYFDGNIFDASKGISLGYYHFRIKSFFYGFFDNFSFFSFKFDVALVFLIIAFFLMYFYKRDKISDRLFKKFSAAFIALNFILIYQGFFNFLPDENLSKPPGIVKFLENRQEEEESFRTYRIFLDYYYDYLSLYKDDSEKIFSIETLAPNISLAYEIDNIEGDDNLMPQRHSDLLNIFDMINVAENDKNATSLIQDNIFPFTDTPDIRRRAKIYSSARARQILGMMNVKYILTPIELGSAISPENRVPWNKVFETKVTKHNIPVYIYENPEVLPRIYFAGSAKTMSDSMPEYQILEELFKIQDFKSQTLIECPENDTLCLQSAFSFQSLLSSKSDSIEIQELRPGYLKLKTISKTPRWLVYSESNLPTWEAKIKESRIWNLESGNNLNQSSKLQTPNSNFRPLKIYTANYIYQAVFIPGGENEIIFEYPGLFKQMRYAIKSLVF